MNLAISLLLAAAAAHAGSALDQLVRISGGVAPPPAAVPAAQRRRPAPLSAGEAAGRLCGGEGVVVVIDNFVQGPIKSYLDVDGDRLPDVNHGDVVSALYEAVGRKTLAWDVEADPSLERLAAIFGTLADRVEAGALRVAAVNLSQVNYVRWEALNKELDFRRPLTLADMGARRGEVARTLADYMLENDSPHYGDLARALARLEALRIPVFVAAGNQGPSYVNTIGFLPAVINVGALARGGGKAAFSADGGLIDVWAPGEHAFRRTAHGVDVNGDGRHDFGVAPMTWRRPYVDSFVGLPVDEAVVPTPDDPDLEIFSREFPAGIQYLRDHMPDKLYETEDFIAFFKAPAGRARSLRSRGRYFDKTGQFGFVADANGRIAYDPAGTGARGQVLLMSGTSFAAPALCWTGPGN